MSPYISSKAALGSVSVENFDIKQGGFGFMGAIGARYAMEYVDLRGELELSAGSYSNEKIDRSYWPPMLIDTYYKFSTTSYMANFYVDLFKSYRIKPYVGVGFGIMSVKSEEDVHIFITPSTNSKTHDTYEKSTFAYGMGGGIGFNITDGLGVDVSVRYNMMTVDNSDISIFSTALGLRYTF
jgi:opacity protein-like surface antigen